MTEDGTPVSRDIPVGFYTVTFSFYNDATQDEAHKLFSCSQTVNIYKNLETNWWKSSTAGATYISNQSGTFTLSPDVIRRYARHNFYVDPQRGSAANAGSWYDPFDSVKTAVQKICSTNDGDPYTVSLLSHDIDTSGTAYTSGNKAYIDIDPAAALTLTILGRDDNDKNVLRTINAERTADKTGRVMYIGSKATVTLSNIVITGGYASDNGGGNAGETNGGGICNAGKLTMTDCTISDCTATGSGGGILNTGTSAKIENTTIIRCTAKNEKLGGGGIYLTIGKLELINVTITGSGNPDTPEAQNGGGIYRRGGTLIITGGIIEDCTAEDSGGGIYNYANSFSITGGVIKNCTSKKALSQDSGGGGIFTKAAASLTDCTISGNTAHRKGGGIAFVVSSTTVAVTATNCTISGNKVTDSGYGGGGVYVHGRFTAIGCTIGGENEEDGNTSAGSGGGFYVHTEKGHLIVTDCTIKRNKGDSGGGIYCIGGGMLTLSGGSVENCTATSGNGGGICLSSSSGWTNRAGGSITGCTITGCEANGLNSSSSYDGFGGGIYISYSANVEITDCIIESCKITTQSTSPYYGGAGICITNGTEDDAPCKLTNCTITDCEAGMRLFGGGVYVGSACTAVIENSEIKNCTVLGTAASTSQGGGIFTTGGTVTVTGGRISGCAAHSGGGIMVRTTSLGGSCTLDGCVVQDNTSTGGNGAVYISGSTTATAVLNVSGAAKITGTGVAQKIYISSAYSAVVITGELTEPVVAKIHSSVYKSAPTVLKDNTDDGSLVKAHYARFQSDHQGYSIYDDGVLRLPPTEGGVVIEEHTCTFSLDKTEITASGDQTLTVTASVTTTGQDGTTQKTFSGADLDWAAIKVFCGMHEVTQADFSGFSVNGGSVTIPFDMWDEAYYVQAAGTYTCENGCKKAFSGQIPFAVRRNAVPAGFVKINGGTVSGSGHPDIPDSAGSEHKGVFIAGRTVTLSPFMMCDHEVTQGEWEEVMAGNADGVTTDPSSCKAGSTNYAVNFGTEQKNRPVESMTWYDAVYYCNERSKKEGLTPVYDISGITVSSYGKINAATVTLIQGGGTRPNGYRLPTEAEWEFAARGGNPNSSAWNSLFSGAATASGTAYNAGVNSGLDSVGWYKYNNKTGTTTADSQTDTADGKGTHEVKQKAANALGLYDMSGNVWEWCWDCTGTVSTGSETDPTGASSESTNRVFRGGAWDNYAYYPNVCRRNAAIPGYGHTNTGFRVVRSVSQ